MYHLECRRTLNNTNIEEWFNIYSTDNETDASKYLKQNVEIENYEIEKYGPAKKIKREYRLIYKEKE